MKPRIRKHFGGWVCYSPGEWWLGWVARTPAAAYEGWIKTIQAR